MTLDELYVEARLRELEHELSRQRMIYEARRQLAANAHNSEPPPLTGRPSLRERAGLQ
jgi:hypothetical protein